ncbi:MAG TPA: alpha-1,4-glucan--maltose-1-phosphate maltosyltransferase [Acidimicrobiales bacterium]|nr:alpha-1,4-glucan--maltose-1-phosphate maltosyltransferase [Acidimicrobiales bacterium]
MPKAKAARHSAGEKKRPVDAVTSEAVPEGAPPGRQARTDRGARPVIGGIRPRVDCGEYPAKATLGEVVAVECDAFADGTDLLACELLFAHESDPEPARVPMRELGDDRWGAGFPVTRLGRYRFSIRADVDPFGSWRRDLRLRAAAAQDLSLDLTVGADLLEKASRRAKGSDRRALRSAAAELRSAPGALDGTLKGATGPAGDAFTDPFNADGKARDRLAHDGTVGGLALSEELADLVGRYRDPGGAAESAPVSVVVEPERARFSAWYELFPRSASPDPDRAGTFADVRERLPYLVRLGFDVLYLPPVHPIGHTNRKGEDGTAVAGASDPGSPWAIGSSCGGHTAVAAELGGIGEFDRLVVAAGEVGIDVAIDLAFQVSPDHPWVGAHPEWFRRLPDGTIRHAENPPKRYEDIYPIDFDNDGWDALWHELLGVVRFWITHGVKLFRVDNPHTKPFRFWRWLIAAVKEEFPEVIFLSEAFTRPKVMKHLAKVGFSQSYTYFAWRNTKWELQDYLTELTRTELVDYFRPNFWPNTPDILTETLQTGGRPAFMARLVLAATLAASYGIYGPAFELQEHLARSAGSEEYRRSEKYSVRHWDLERSDSLADFVARINDIRRRHPALQWNETLRFHQVDNEQLIVYSKIHPAAPSVDRPAEGEDADTIVVVVNLDPFHGQSGWVDLDLPLLAVDAGRPYVMHDLLTGAHYRWEGSRNFVLLDPDAAPAHVFSLERPPARPREIGTVRGW